MRTFNSLILLLASLTGFAQHPLVITDATKPSPVSAHTYFLEDLSHELTYDKVYALPLSSFQVSPNKKIVQLGYRAGTVWLRFDVKNQTKSDLFLISSFLRYALLDAYVLDENGQQTHFRSGFNQSSVAEQIIVNPTVIPLGKHPKRVFIRFDINDAFGDYLHIGDISLAFSYKQSTDRWQNLALGAFLITFLFAFVFFIKLRDPLVGWYALLMFSLILFYIDFYDHLSKYIDYGFWRKYIPTSFIYLQCWTLFHIHFLNLRHYSKFLYWAIVVIMGVYWLDWPVSMIVIVQTGKYFSILYNLLYWLRIDWGGYIFFMMTLLLVSLVYVSFYKFKELYLYAIAFLFSVISMMISLFALYGIHWLPFLPFNNTFVPGTLIEIIILGYILGDRANEHRRRQFQTQQDLITQLKENLNQKNKLLRLRDQIARDLHDEIGATLTSIAISTKLVQKKMGPELNGIGPILAQIQTDSQETIRTIRDTVWALNPDNDALEKLFERMQTTGFQILAHQDIAFTFQNNLAAGQLPSFTTEQRKNIYYVYREALHNIAKHAKATKVNVQITGQDDVIKIEIQDNGRGFDLSGASEGNGLFNFQKRAVEGSFKVVVSSVPGQGTILEIRVPVETITTRIGEAKNL